MEKEVPQNSTIVIPQVEEEVIYDVNSATTRLLHSKYGKAVTALVVVSMVWVIILMIYWYVTLQFPHPYFFFLVILPFGILYATVQMQARKAFMKQFASANGYTYQESGLLDRHESVFLNFGEDHSITNYISGMFSQYPIELFDYSYAIRSGKSRRTMPYTVFCVEFPTLLPDMLLLYEHALPVQHLSKKGRMKLFMDAAFEALYELYITPDFEIEALQIFDYEFMAKLQGEWKGFSLEFFSNRIYLYYHGLVNTKPELDRMYALAKYLITHLAAVSQRMDSGLKAMKVAYAPKVKPL